MHDDLKFATKSINDRFDNIAKRINENDFGSASVLELDGNEDEEKKNETEYQEKGAAAPESKTKEKVITTHVELTSQLIYQVQKLNKDYAKRQSYKFYVASGMAIGTLIIFYFGVFRGVNLLYQASSKDISML